MARPRSSGYDEQRDIILAQAAALFARQGYAGTSMNEVAAACGVSKPALYHYVRDKHALLALICEDHVQRLQALVQNVALRAQAQGLDARGHLHALILAFVEAYADAAHEHRVLTEDERHLGPAERERVLGGQREVVAAFADLVAAQRPGLIAADLAKPLAMLLFGMINWMFTWLRPGGALRHADMAPLVAELFLGGLTSLAPATLAGLQTLTQPPPAAEAISLSTPTPRRQVA
jgi:TetR/AcrR family transcriptional regulator